MIFNAQAAALLISLPGNKATPTPAFLGQAISVLITLATDVSINKTLSGEFVMSHFGAAPVHGKFTCISASDLVTVCKSDLRNNSIKALGDLSDLYSTYLLDKENKSNLCQIIFDRVTYSGYLTSIEKATQTKYPGVVFYLITFIGQRVS